MRWRCCVRPSASPEPGAIDFDDTAAHTDVFVEETEVAFGKLSPEAIQEYVASGEPMDKAGSYGIQGFAGAFVSGINGCYHNVVGFPMHRFASELDTAKLKAGS